MTPRASRASFLILAVVVAAPVVGGCGGAADDSVVRETGAAPAAGTAAGQAQGAGPTTDVGSTTDAGPQDAGLPAGWSLRLDRAGSDPSEFRVARDGEALELRTGPAGILWRGDDAVAEGEYGVSATFTEVGAPAGHREGYGLFVGGSDLQGEGQAYTYFLVRGDGSFLIKRRAGSATSSVTDGWRPSETVAAAGDGDPTNTLSIRVEAGSVRFLVNGQDVATVPAGEVDAHGVAGLRVNHNLHLRVEDFSVGS